MSFKTAVKIMKNLGIKKYLLIGSVLTFSDCIYI